MHVKQLPRIRRTCLINSLMPIGTHEYEYDDYYSNRVLNKPFKHVYSCLVLSIEDMINKYEEMFEKHMKILLLFSWMMTMEGTTSVRINFPAYV